MVTSYVWLKERYNVVQVEAALAVLGGVLIALVPQVSSSTRLPLARYSSLLFLG
jgi:hypothetical protein